MIGKFEFWLHYVGPLVWLCKKWTGTISNRLNLLCGMRYCFSQTEIKVNALIAYICTHLGTQHVYWQMAARASIWSPVAFYRHSWLNWRTLLSYLIDSFVSPPQCLWFSLVILIPGLNPLLHKLSFVEGLGSMCAADGTNLLFSFRILVYLLSQVYPLLPLPSFANAQSSMWGSVPAFCPDLVWLNSWGLGHMFESESFFLSAEQKRKKRATSLYVNTRPSLVGEGPCTDLLLQRGLCEPQYGCLLAAGSDCRRGWALMPPALDEKPRGLGVGFICTG